jgi:hypothetical protein
MDDQKDTGFDKLFVGLLGTALAVFLAAVGAYYLHLGLHAGFSQNSKDWAEFGEYLGGTLGGFFGLLAFIGVLITIFQQRTQLQLTRSQFNRDELQRLVATTWTAAEDVLNKRPSVVPPHIAYRLSSHGGNPTVHHILSVVGTAALRQSTDYMINASNQNLLGEITEAIGLDAGVLAIVLDQLAECLLAYREAGGSFEVERIYSRRAGAYATWLEAAGFKVSHQIKQYYDTAARKTSMTAELNRMLADPGNRA